MSKWIQLSPGHYRLVEDDDPRPAVKLKARKGTPNIKYVPSWKKYETPMFMGDGHSQFDAADRFTKEREDAIHKDPKAARWEKSRREWFAKQKPAWRKKEIARLKEQGL